MKELFYALYFSAQFYISTKLRQMKAELTFSTLVEPAMRDISPRAYRKFRKIYRAFSPRMTIITYFAREEMKKYNRRDFPLAPVSSNGAVKVRGNERSTERVVCEGWPSRGLKID